MVINIVPFIFTLLLIFTFITGVITLLTSVENTYQRNSLIYLICVWVGLIGLIARRQLIVYYNTEVIEGYLNNGLILGGMIGVLSLVIYGASVLFHKRFNWKRILLFMLPAIITVVINFTLNTYEGIAANHFYPTLIDFLENISTHGLISRIVMFAIQIAYIAILIYNIIHLVPIYNKYFEETQSEDRYNMNWLYGYIASICAISVAYISLKYFSH